MRGASLLCAVLGAAIIAGCGPSTSPPSSGPNQNPGQTTADAPPPITGIPPEHLDEIVRQFNRGVALMDQYQAAKAAEAFDEVVRLAPGWPTGRLNLGIALLNAQGEERFRRAEQELKTVIAQQPDNCRAHYALGMLLRHLTRFDEAKEHFERVLQIDPEDADAHYQYGILIIDDDPAAAREHLEKTLAKIPHHQSACYRLQSLLRKLGQPERAQELLERFQMLKTTGTGVTAGMKYGEMGRYAEVVRELDVASEPDAPKPLRFVDVAEDVGLTIPAHGNPGWPGDPGVLYPPRSLSERPVPFGPGVAVADVDTDGDLDLYIPGLANRSGGVLYKNDGGRFAPMKVSFSPEIPAEYPIHDPIFGDTHAIGAYFGDYDADGDPDLYLTCYGPNRLFRNDGGGRFADVSEATGTAGGGRISVGAAWADADHDGDLDLYVANFATDGVYERPQEGVGNYLFRNNGDGSFTEVAAESGVDGGNSPTMSVVFFDVDEDHDLDLYLVNHRAPNQVFLNDRVGRYRDATSQFPLLADDGPGLGAVLGDLNQDGREDVLLIRGPQPPKALLSNGRGQFVESSLFVPEPQALPPSENTPAELGVQSAVGAVVGDLDLDTDLDVVLLSAERKGKTGHFIWTNTSPGAFARDLPATSAGDQQVSYRPPQHFADQPALPAARGAVAADFDGDGLLEILVARVGDRPELWRLETAPDRHWLAVLPSKVEGAVQRRDLTAVGMQIEVKTGLRLQVRGIRSADGYLGSPPPRAHFGLGDHGTADYVRLTWPDAVFQSELEVPADQRWQIAKVMRKPSSCPVLFSWDGHRFAYVTDVLGVGGVGFFTAPGQYAPPDPTEDVRIPASLVRPHDGRYLLRLAEPLEEVVYLDQLHLIAYDHPPDCEVYPNERFSYSPPAADGRPIAIAQRLFPQAARDEAGRDVLDRIRKVDRRYVEPPADPRFVGYAADHWLELDFGDRLPPPETAGRLWLFLYGWTEYTYSHVNYAAYQAGETMRSPAIEVPDGRGGWRVATTEAGFPAGLPRMMAVDISDLPIREHGRLRIRTNMEVFWDQVFVAQEAGDRRLKRTVLRPTVADLRPLGYPQEYSPDGSDPTRYDYHRLEHGVPFKNMTGDFTRFGAVRPLLEAVDDRFVIMGRGEEIALEFSAAELPPLPAGWSRTFVVHFDGYCKDMDLYTARGSTVTPLPYHGMDNYPPPAPPPELDKMIEYQKEWNTRRVSAD